MEEVKVFPIVCAQDIKKSQKSRLNKISKIFGQDQLSISYFESSDNHPDARARMLYEGIKKVKTRYLAFLDYDDLLMPIAYNYLLNRLQKTKKTVTFGRVFKTLCKTKDSLFIKRTKDFEYNATYEDYIKNNHAPIHSFMIDISKVNLNTINLDEDQIYMEDYYLMMQIIRIDNTDWESLKINHYIGDYIHPADRTSTLSVFNAEKVQSITREARYKECDLRIRQLKDNIIKDHL
jgi:hypothetical protein